MHLLVELEIHSFIFTTVYIYYVIVSHAYFLNFIFFFLFLWDLFLNL